MMRKITVLIFALSLYGTAQAELLTRESAHSVQETMDRFEAIVKEKGMTVFARVDHAKNAGSVGMEMPDSQLLIFGNPKGGTVLMQQDMRVGIALPLKVLVYSNAEGKTLVVYENPLALSERYKLENIAVLEKVAGGLDKMTTAASR
ncbi:MAG: DUF302 domain-containing protein [Sedimenticolaceae bacterium]|nr:DUF302 domain-containing protein [Sedimenticolaceae bacterium]